MKLETFLANLFFCSKFGKEMCYEECVKKYSRANAPCTKCANGKVLTKKQGTLAKEKEKELKAIKAKQRTKEKKEKDTKKKARQEALQHFKGIYEKLPTEAKMKEYQKFLQHLLKLFETRGSVLYIHSHDVIEASGCPKKEINYDTWITELKRYGFIKAGEKLEWILYRNHIRSSRTISVDSKTYNEMCDWLGLNRLKIQPELPSSPPTTAP